jgi:predicted DCC family thiol-disulfide oxidoreductase YuxK
MTVRLPRCFAIATVALLFFEAARAAWVAPAPQPLISRKASVYLLGSSRAGAEVAVTSPSRDLLPPSAVAERVFATDKRPIILFDGVCNMCNNAVNLALDWDPRGNLRFAALQSDVGRALLEKNGRRADDITTIVLVASDGAYTKSDAILKITEALAPPFLPTKPAVALGRMLIPQFVRDLIYDQVADNRYQLMGKRDTCRFDAEGEFVDRFVKEELAYDS